MIDPTTINPDCLYKTSEAARLIGITSQWLVQMLNRNGIKPIDPKGRPLRWAGRDLWKLLKYEPPALDPVVAAARRKLHEQLMKKINAR